MEGPVCPVVRTEKRKAYFTRFGTNGKGLMLGEHGDAKSSGSTTTNERTKVFIDFLSG
jgi:hypothetical protein